jgi:TP901-1 family phage major tail protein
MTNYTGRAFVLKIGTWAAGTTVADCREHSFVRNNEQVDITNKSSNAFRTLLEGAGTKSLDITMSGAMTNDTAFETLQGYAFANSINVMSMQYADGDTIEASFAVSSFTVGGVHNGEQTFSCTLQSSGAITFTAA